MAHPELTITAVIVVYNPDLHALSIELESLVDQVDSIILVDNGSAEDVAVWNESLASKAGKVIRLDDNYGMACAQNRGIELAKQMNSAYVLLMDQDTIPKANAVAFLLATYERLCLEHVKVGAVGCRYQENDQAALSGFFRYSARPGNRNVRCRDGESEIECELLIASGSLIRIDVLDDVGLMEEGLFIDRVDTEWCLRAQHKGYRLFGACHAVMQHDLGLYRKRIWFLRWRETSVHKPFRYYYMLRNSILLLSRSYPVWAWKRFEMERIIMMFVFYGIILPNRVPRIKMMLKGLWDGLNGRMGKLSI
jgi:rhamnosyltransferase